MKVVVANLDGDVDFAFADNSDFGKTPIDDAP